MKIGICDDDIKLAGELEDIILKYNKINNKDHRVHVFYSGLELSEELDRGNLYDLIFLDIEMDGMNGLEVGEKIRREMDDFGTQIIYISSKEGYDRQLFDFQPLHFIVKPIKEDIVFKDIRLAERIIGRIRNPNMGRV